MIGTGLLQDKCCKRKRAKSFTHGGVLIETVDNGIHQYWIADFYVQKYSPINHLGVIGPYDNMREVEHLGFVFGSTYGMKKPWQHLSNIDKEGMFFEASTSVRKFVTDIQRGSINELQIILEHNKETREKYSEGCRY